MGNGLTAVDMMQPQRLQPPAAKVSAEAAPAESATAKLVVLLDSDNSTGPSDRNGLTAFSEMCMARLAA
eukprot:SAG31_NODE_1383_length_8578_cov_3.660573_5_plen_69_part_00